MTRPKPKPGEPTALFPDEAEIAVAVLGQARAKQWPGLAVVLERNGLPRVDPQFGARYWPAVKAFLDRRAGMERDRQPDQDPGIVERFDASPRRPARARS